MKVIDVFFLFFIKLSIISCFISYFFENDHLSE